MAQEIQYYCKCLTIGEWKNWLEANFKLIQDTTTNFMHIAYRFGSLLNNQNSESIWNVGVTQMIQLLKLPKGAEEKFIVEQGSVSYTRRKNDDKKSARR